MKVVFFGTADLACASLKALAEEPTFHLAGVTSQPDKPKGRDLVLQPTPVKQLALQLGCPVFQPIKARDPEFIETIRNLAPDVIAVAAYGQILKPELLNIPRLGCLNVHTSLLPKYRGAAPIQWAIYNGDSETGVTIMKMDEGMDTGAILSQLKVPILDSDTGQTLHDRLAEAGGKLLVQTIKHFAEGKITPVPQPLHGISYAAKISKENGRIDWSRPAVALWNQIRAFTPWPGSFCYLQAQSGKSVLLKILEAKPVSGKGQPGTVLHAGTQGIVVATNEGALEIISLQKEGGKRLSAQDFLRGNPIAPGQILS